MGLNVQHNGLVNVIKSAHYFYKHDAIKILRIRAGYRQRPESTSEIDNVGLDLFELAKHAKSLIDKDKPQYYLAIEGEAYFDGDSLKGRFDLYYNSVSIRVEAATNELEEKLKETLELSFVAPSLLDFFESLDNISDII